MTLALERKDAQQVVERIGDIGTLVRRGLGRDPIEVLQCHDMVNAQSAGMSHIGAYQLDEAAVGLGLQRLWVKRRQSPVLASWIEDIRWGANSGVTDNYTGICPVPRPTDHRDTDLQIGTARR